MARNRDPFATALRTLRARAVSGAFRPGRPIIILDEAQALGLSTTPVREALAWLGGEGLIQRSPGGGYVGLSLDTADLVGRYRMRLHCLTAGGRTTQAYAGTSAPHAFSDTASLFRSIVASAADPVLLTVYENVQATLVRFAPVEADLLQDPPHELETIALRLTEGDSGSATDLLRRHHDRRIQAAPLPIEREQVRMETG